MTTVIKGWEVWYLDTETENLVELEPADFQHIEDGVGVESQAVFRLPNTRYYRELVNQWDPALLVFFFFNYEMKFAGEISAFDAISNRILEVYVGDSVALQLDAAEPVTGVYDEVPANEVLAEVLENTDILSGDCPTSPITCVLYKAVPLDVIDFISDALGYDRYSSEGTTINIGFQGGGQSNYIPPEYIHINRHGKDLGKKADKVIIRGIDTFGHHVTGEAQSEDYPYLSHPRIRTFNEDTPANQEALEAMAVKRIAELNRGFTGAPVSITIDRAYGLEVGNYFWIDKPRFFLSDNVRIMKLTFEKRKVAVELGRQQTTIVKAIEDLRSWEKKGIYLPGCTSWTINLQDLVGFYHLNEGAGVVARDSSPRVDPQDGNIVNCAWQENQYLKFLTFNGGSSYVDIGDSITFQSTGEFSIGGWISPSVEDGASRNIVHKDGQFTLKVVNGAIVLVVYDSGGTPHTYTTNSIVAVGGRNFIMATYDGATIRIYRNTKVVLEQSISMSIHASINKVYIGVAFQGALGEMMLWQRCLYDQEVVELYFFPLVRTV